MPARWPLYRYLIRTVYKSVGDPICSNPVSNFESSLSFQKLSKIPPTHTHNVPNLMITVNIYSYFTIYFFVFSV